MNLPAIHVVNLGFTAEQFQAVVAALRQAGYPGVVPVAPETLRATLGHPTNKLSLLCVAGYDPVRLLAEIKAAAAEATLAPILLYLAAAPTGNWEALLLAPEVDEFLVASLPPALLCLRVKRLLQRGADAWAQNPTTVPTHAALRQLIGESAAFSAIKEKIARSAACDATVLITGETGTGKELCARALHLLSRRGSGPFIPLNCSAVPTELFENELFGHEAGAFTDARQPRRGLVAEAEGGTFFLDEVDSLAPQAQVKLLRFLQEREYKPLGATQCQHANLRILAATNQDLKRQVREQKFREDLYFRLQLLTLPLPPLRERRADIVPLAYHFLRAAAREYQCPASRFTPAALARLTHHTWPGNVRELENVVRQAVILAGGPVIGAAGLDLSGISEEQPSALESFQLAKARVVETFERDYLEQVMAACDGNVSRAARLARKERRTFFALLKKHDLLARHSCPAGAFETPRRKLLTSDMGQ